MSQVEDLLRDLVVANRILANEDVVDAYGHISVRHPDNPKRFFMARSLAPELVERHDLIEFDAEGEPVNDKRQPYLERFIHAAILAARPDVTAVVHAHAEDTLPFGLVKEPLQPVIHSGSFIGGKVPVWDIRNKFGDTN
ncbi:MAG: class II aldolase/adducin family protein, partial [Xanthobacteraceae bacterium]